MASCSLTVRIAKWVMPVGYVAAFAAYPFVGEDRAVRFASWLIGRGIRVETTAA